jgi:sugar (pentulose or hexulose) kinase
MSGWVGLDIGTTSSKAVVYDDTGQPLASSRRPTVWHRDASGTEIDPNQLRDGAVDTLAEAIQRLPQRIAIAGVGITSMGETGVLVDHGGRPIAPAIAWHDRRDDAELAELRRDIGPETFAVRAGKPLRGQFSITKHRWLTRHASHVASAVRWFNVAEWVALGLGADEACDRSLACRTGWFDISANRWWDEALSWSGASATLMPPLVQSGEPIGRVTADRVPHALSGAVVALAGHDHQAAALGVGAVLPGDELDSSGTAEALVRNVLPELGAPQLSELARAGITTDLSIQPHRWSLLGGTEGGLAMRRVLDVLGVTNSDLPDLDRQALATTSGRITVHGIGTSGLCLDGIGDGVGPGDLWRAVVETATAEAVRLHEAMSAVAGPHNRLIATGGWCYSEMVMRAKHEGFGEVLVASASEAGTLGAATIAARAAGQLGPHEILGQGTRDDL